MSTPSTNPARASETPAARVAAPSATPFTAPSEERTRPVLRGSFGMVASTHWLASAAAQSVLERGGTAVDAACAGAFVLHVVEPHLNGPGGDLVAIHAEPGGTPRVVVGQGAAPASADVEGYLARGLDLVPGAGSLAATIPGAVPSWFALLREHGTWELADVLALAIEYARGGHEPIPQLLRTIGTVERLFLEHWPTSRAQWMPDGVVPERGRPIRNEAYAATLDRLIDAGRDETDREGRIRAAERAWSEGFVARAIDAFVREPHRHSDGRDHAGVLAASDLAGHETTMEDTVSIDFRGVEVHTSAAWGQGPVLLQALRILDCVAGDAGPSGDARLDPSTALGVHTITEALKLALADRDAYYGDDERAVLALPTLLSTEYARGRAALIGETASLEHRPGVVPGVAPFAPPLRIAGQEEGERAGTGEPTVRATGETRGDTCHLDVVDRWGTMISATPSGGWLQSSPTIPELGFCLGTRLQMAWLDADSPSALRPGRRPRTTLAPTLLVRDGRPVAALGTPGGDQQDQWQLLYLLRTLVGGYDPQQAIDAPAFHTTALVGSFWPRTWEPGGLVVEGRIGEDVIAELERRGHRVTRSGDWTLGRLTVVGSDEPGRLYAAANPRNAQGYAAGR